MNRKTNIIASVTIYSTRFSLAIGLMPTLNQIIRRDFKHCLHIETNSKVDHTHTRIPDIGRSAGGKFDFSSDYDRFLEAYIEHVIKRGEEEYMTEKQLQVGPVLVDLDFKYPPKFSRQHNSFTIVQIIETYVNALKRLLEFPAHAEFDVYVFERDDVVKKDSLTKDGIHLLFGLSMHRNDQISLRNEVLSNISVEIPHTTNEWSDIIDYAITRGSSPWQMYGSRKPSCDPYMLTYRYRVEIENGVDKLSLYEEFLDLTVKENFEKISARYSGYVVYPARDKVNHEHKTHKPITSVDVLNLNKRLDADTLNDVPIVDAQSLQVHVDEVFRAYEKSLSVNIHELFEFVHALPAIFYELNKGTYQEWRRVGFALYNTSPELFAFWVSMSAKAADFDYDEVCKMRSQWDSTQSSFRTNQITHRSIRYWVRQYNPSAYQRITEASIERHIESKLSRGANETDIASTLSRMTKDTSVCSQISSKRWYQFKSHRWIESDSAESVYMLISTKLYDLYERMITKRWKLKEDLDDDEDDSTIRDELTNLGKITRFLLETSKKRNIMDEVKYNLHDDTFLKKIDTNPYLLCFKNTVVDFENHDVRDGRPDDYLTMCTNTIYVPLQQFEECEDGLLIIREINEFFEQLLPVQQERDYVWSHLASCLMGTNNQQAIQIWIGKGCNGKTKLIELCKKVLGDYYGTCPVGLITQKRSAVGGTTSEIAQLRGVRMAIMQEPSKNDNINDGVLKQITGSDEIIARQLYKESFAYLPQFKLIMCTNALPSIKVQDDGFWRRVRLVTFRSKFLEKPYMDERFPKKDYPYQFPIDQNIEKKFERWVPVLTSMLVDLTFRNKGRVHECNIVTQQSLNYRKEQDIVKKFVLANIIQQPDARLTKSEVYEFFRAWYIQHQGSADRDMPKGNDLFEVIDSHCGPFKNNCWINYGLQY